MNNNLFTYFLVSEENGNIKGLKTFATVTLWDVILK